jgi:hypothetical protein
LCPGKRKAAEYSLPPKKRNSATWHATATHARPPAIALLRAAPASDEAKDAGTTSPHHEVFGIIWQVSFADHADHLI